MIDLYLGSIALRALAAGWLIACGLLCSIRLARWLVPEADAVLRWSTIFSVGTWLSTIGFHALFALHAFQLGFALLAGSVALMIAIVASPAHDPLGRLLRRERRAIGAIARSVRRGRYFAIWCVFGVFAAPLALRAFVIPPLGWDTLTYHAPRAAQWVQAHRFTFDQGVGSYDFYRHFFSGGEVLMAWAMLPFHSDLLANLASVAQWIGVGLSSWALARAIGLKEPFASTSAAMIMFAPTMQSEVNSGYVELPLDAALLQGIALALHCLRRPRIGAVVACAMALGVATGIKLPAAPPAAIFALLVAFRLVRAHELTPARRSIALGLCALVVLAPAAPWMLRAWIDTGYPLSPLPIDLLGHKLGVASAMVRWYGER
ncbi:MAG TPA: hypothetical protein VHZ95_17615, partial [Polyangiales bacterium]|nr:hypothetical protein [Polyangiales bacterium]